MDKEMYDGMSTLREANHIVSRGVALHKMIRAFTMGLGGEGYLNFMGNEFGHPEWIDFPREDRVEAATGKFIPGNGNSYHLCRRRFDLADMDHLRYKFMYRFDAALNAAEGALGFLASNHQYVSKKDNGDKVIVFERGDALFVFNWHPTKSYNDYRVGCKQEGIYAIALNSDDPEYGGHGNVKSETTALATAMPHDGRPASFQVYAPSRTVVVYTRTG
jgi:1,4-alpha-glucan branching enzyme